MDDGQTMLFQAVLIPEVSFAVLAHPVGDSEGRDLRFGVRVVDFARQMLVESLLVKKVAVTITAMVLCCVDG